MRKQTPTLETDAHSGLHDNFEDPKVNINIKEGARVRQLHSSCPLVFHFYSVCRFGVCLRRTCEGKRRVAAWCSPGGRRPRQPTSPYIMRELPDLDKQSHISRKLGLQQYLFLWRASLTARSDTQLTENEFSSGGDLTRNPSFRTAPLISRTRCPAPLTQCFQLW